MVLTKSLYCKSLVYFLFLAIFFSSAGFAENPAIVLTGFYENQPKIFTKDGKPAGIFIDILEKIGEKNNFKPKYIKCSWPQCIKMLKSGEIELMPDVAFSIKRNESFNFNREIVFESFSQIYTRNDLKLEKFSDLNGLTIALLQGSIQEKTLVTMTSGLNIRLKVLHVDSYEEAFKLASHKIVDAAVSNHFFGEYFYKEFNLSKTPIVFNPASLYFAAPKNSDRKILDKIDASLKTMKINPGSPYYKALEKWMERPPTTAVPKYIYLIFIFLGSFLFVLVLIILFLKLTLKRKKISLALFKKQVQKSEKRFTELFETMGSAVIFQNKNMEVILANKQAEKLFGFSFKTLKNTQRNIFQNAVTEDGFKITEQNNPFFSVLKNDKKINSLVVGLKNPDLNNLKWILINATPESDEISNDYQGVLFVMEDITEMKIMEEELIKRNTELEQIFDTVPDAMIYADKNRNILKVNKSFTRIFHYLPKEVKNKNTSFLYNNFEDYKIQGQIRYTKDSPKITLPYELEYKKKSSDVFTGETIGSRLTDPKGNTLGILILIRDVTEKRKLETIINRTQKIESIGRIAGSIAHDFNNILTVISGYSDLIDIKSSKLPDINSQAVQIKNAVSKAQKLTRHLLTFSRKQTLNFSKTDINQLIKNFRDFLYPVLGKNISLYLNFSEPVCNVKADSGQIEQILMNLAVNSKDAFKEKGKITISTMKKTINFSDKPLINLPPGKYALIKFEDNGPGIPKEVMEHIFEPFFTTKTKEKGTGLGLSTVYGITKLHGGEVTVSSFPGSGTVFSIYLPCFDN